MRSALLQGTPEVFGDLSRWHVRVRQPGGIFERVVLQPQDVAAALVPRHDGGPMDSDRGTVLAQIEVDEVMLPGDTVVLFLVTGPDGTDRVLPGAGQYRISGDQVSALHANPFAPSVSGLSVNAFLARVALAR